MNSEPQTKFMHEEAVKVIEAAIGAGLINLPFLAQCRADHLSKLIQEELPAAGEVSASTLHERTLEAERTILDRELSAAARRDALYLRHFFAALQGIDLKD